MNAQRRITVAVQEGDALDFRCDVLALKFAQSLYGVDLAVCERLEELGQRVALPKNNEVRLLPTSGRLGAKAVLFVGVVPLVHFDYQQIRECGRRVLASMAGDTPSVAHLALTIHGPGYGLDEIEAMMSELAGVVEAILTHDFPPGLERISLVERNPGRANANVYLEVGYSWGCGRPTILLVRDPPDLRFDVKGQRCLVYKSIKHLEELLGKELQSIAAAS